MADQPTPSAGSTAVPPLKTAPPDTTQNPVAQMTDDEYMAALNASRNGTPANGATPEETPGPVTGFWNRLLQGGRARGWTPANPQSTLAQDRALAVMTGKSAVRGIAKGLNNMGRSALEFGFWLDRKTGLGELTNPGFNEAFDTAGGARGFVNQNPDAAKVLPEGNRIDDPLATFSENTAQFLTGMAGAQWLGVPSAVLQGAFADATAFDPYEAQLAELAAKAPGTLAAPLRAIGRALSVGGDDGVFQARVKRAIPGAAMTGLFEGLFHSARILLAAKTLTDPAASIAAKEAAQGVIAEAQPIVDAVAQAQHTGAGEHVVVRPAPGGIYTLEVAPRSSVAEGLDKRAAQIIAEGNGPTAEDLIRMSKEQNLPLHQIATNLEAQGTPISDELIRKVNNLVAEQPPTPSKVALTPEGSRGFSAEGPPTPTGEEDIARAHTLEETQALFRRLDAAHRELDRQATVNATEFANEAAPTFSDRGEAEAVAASMNGDLNARMTARAPITAEETAAHFDLAQQMLKAPTAEDAARLAQGTHLNLSVRADPLRVRAHVEAISKQFKLAMDATKGPVPVDEIIRQANKAIGGLTPSEARGVYYTGKGEIPEGVRLLAGNRVLSHMGAQLADMSDVLQARPHDAILHDQARAALDQYYAMLEDISGAHSDAGRTLRMLKETGNPKLNAPLRPEGSPAPIKAIPEAAAEEPPKFTAGMSQRDVRAQVRMIQMADGKPRNAFAVVHAAQVIKHEGKLGAAMEVFVNGLLSGPRTAQTVLASGLTVNLFEPFVRTMAGLMTFNSKLAQEGADIMFGNFMYFRDRIEAAAASLRSGTSALNPQPQHIYIGGLTGDIVRAPGRPLTAFDEFNRVTGYRAYVRAKSLRLGREQGLTGTALNARVAEDLRSAFDPNTGVTTIPEALQYAETSTFSGPLAPDSFGKGFQTFVNNHIEAKVIAPFVKSSSHLINYAWKSTPILNLLNSEARAAMAKGGEEAAVLHTRSAIAGTIYSYGMYQAMAGNLTGRGPSDPALKKLWLRDHQPYSMKVGNTWVSYAKMEPFATFLGLMGDANTIIHELGDKEKDLNDVLYGTAAAIFYNLSNKSWLQGITQFANAWADNDPHALSRWINQTGSAAAVPFSSLVTALNPDPVVRDVRSFADAVMNRIPGFELETPTGTLKLGSTKLDPRFDWSGEEVHKTPGLMNRNQIFTMKDNGNSVDSDLFQLGKGLSPVSPTLEKGLIDLRDKVRYNENPKQPSPYIRFMQLLRNPEDGGPSLRDAMTELVKSDEWQQSSDGTSLMPGGKRWILAAALKTKYEKRAMQVLLDEYPKLAADWNLIRRSRGAAIASGEEGVNEVQQMFAQ